MTDMQAKGFKTKDGKDVLNEAEMTTPGLVFSPQVDIFEKDLELVILADMPGVRAEDVDIVVHEGKLTISGAVSIEKGPDEREVSLEFEPGRYYRQFTLSDSLDEEKIESEMVRGVLRLTLPKAEKALSRKIPVASE
jgi:HSP20 family molecular chaperone IbpA